MQLRAALDDSRVEYQLPEGAAGTRATLRLMAGLVRETRILPAIRNTAADIVSSLAAQNFTAEADAIFCFVRDQIRYLQDTNNVEVIQNPCFTLDFRQGDCDDKSTLLAALLESVGHPCRFVAVGYTHPGEFEHVYVETRIGGQWIPLESTEQVPMGWAPLYPNVPAQTTAFMREWV